MYLKDYCYTSFDNAEIIGMDILGKLNMHMPYMIFILGGGDLALLFANQIVFEVLGYGVGDLQGMNQQILNRAEAGHIAEILNNNQQKQFSDDKHILKLAINLQTKYGLVIPVTASISVFKRNTDGTPVSWFFLAPPPARFTVPGDCALEMENVQKKLEAKVAELAKAYEEVEQFSYVASHDLQEPLRKISAFGRRLKDKCGTILQPDCALYLDRMLDGAGRMQTLIENLLTLSQTKRKTDYFRSTDLNEIMAEVITDLEDAITEKVAVINHSPLRVIDAIPTQMHQLLLNILSNSLKFAKADINAVIHVSSEFLTGLQKNEYDLDLHQEYVHLLLEDNGIGFEMEFADAIFMPFKRLHGRSEYQGTGIGLAICKKVVQNHKGLIWAVSSPGNGAALHIVLPLVNPDIISKTND
jgi:signal transduction histidine kinase